MGGYVASFTVYTMAMIGLICFAVFVYKKIMDGGLGKKHTRFIEIEDTLNLNPRKSLHVIKAGNEKFLIASDMDRTTLISKLDGSRQVISGYENSADVKQTFRNAMEVAAQQEQAIKTTKKAPQKVHLEPITRRNNHGIGISNLRNSMDMRAGQIQQTSRQQAVAKMPVQKQGQPVRRPVPQQVQPAVQKSKVVTAGSTMKDMAKKINQL